MRGCYCWAAFRNKRKLKSPAVQRHPKLREQGVRGGGWLRKNERPKFLSFPAGVFQIPQATASWLCEWSKQPEGKLKRTARGREPHSWGDASPTHRIERHSTSVSLPGKVCNRLCSMALSFSVLPCRESLWHYDISFQTRTCSLCLSFQKQASSLYQAFIVLCCLVLFMWPLSHSAEYVDRHTSL